MNNFLEAYSISKIYKIVLEYTLKYSQLISSSDQNRNLTDNQNPDDYAKYITLIFKNFHLISGFALCQIYLQLSINHKEVMMELNNYENWPVNMWAGGNMEQLKNQIRGLKRICMVS